MGKTFAEILIKPVSMRCNLSCDYCFYLDECNHRSEKDKGIMTEETASLLITKALELPSDSVCFTFQGGEPTLAGIDFYKFFINETKKRNSGNKEILWSIQTNGTLLNNDFAKLLQENNFLVGISLDGPEKIHEKHRGTGSYNKAINGLNELREYNINPNVLCVVTNNSNAKEIYDVFKKLGFFVQQYIPCLDSMGINNNKFLSPEHFGNFLCELYDLWINDLKKGNNISIRYFENLALILSENEAESCNFCGGCKLQFVTESNGDIYPCDFYCLDEYKLGNIQSTSYIEVANTNIAKDFSKKKIPTDYNKKCQSCKFFKLCKAGCRREYQNQNLTQFCESYMQLFEHIRTANH